MADEDDINKQSDDEKPKGRSKMIIIIAVVLLVLAGAGGGAFWYLNSIGEVEVVNVGEYGEEEEVSSGGLFGNSIEKAIYHRLRPPFVTTFEANSKQRYMQAEVTLVTRDSAVDRALTTHRPLIRHALVMLFASQDYLALQTPKGKKALKKSALEAVRKILFRESGLKGVERVLFTEFVLQ